MARVQPSSIVHTVRGSVGEETYQIDRNRQIVRSRPTPTPPPAQGETGYDQAKLQAWIAAEHPVRAAGYIWRRLKAGSDDAPTTSFYRGILDSGPDRGATYRALVKVCADVYYRRKPDWPFNKAGHHVTEEKVVDVPGFNSVDVTISQPHPHRYYGDIIDLDVLPERTLTNPRLTEWPLRPDFDWSIVDTGVSETIVMNLGYDDGANPQLLWIWPVLHDSDNIVTAVGRPYLRWILKPQQGG